MRLFDVTLFSDKGRSIKVNFLRTDGDEVALSINDRANKYLNPAIFLFLKNETEFINFKNSVIWAFEEYMRKKKDD